ncbi:hypothetical protein LAZ67_11002578 [Cordylochernes scorpioides]|uniref:Reverse transcriptase domain-containing protein n=1 Tax=Cordylochernes scorpioides TaxID=51811 RepID=A0ABY6KZD7_9ARAC|nr:hypothetical protein LAZ67_11002578 [Cordylochernes scorpioides]
MLPDHMEVSNSEHLRTVQLPLQVYTFSDIWLVGKTVGSSDLNSSVIIQDFKEGRNPNIFRRKKLYPTFTAYLIIHKPNIPLRPIVSYAGSPLYPLTKFLSSVISPFQKQLPHTVPNPIVAVEAIKTVQISNDSRMNLYTPQSRMMKHSWPSDHFLKSTRNSSSLSKEALIDLIKLCLDHSYFSFKDRFFRQIKGLPMGNPISSALANIFMNEIDEKIINSNQFKIILWLRYIDDIFCLTETNIESFLRFLNSLNLF